MVSGNSLLIQHVRKFLLHLYCSQILFYYKLSSGIIQKKMYPTLLYSIRPQIPSYSTLSANSLLFYIVHKFWFVLNCPQVSSNKYMYPTLLFSIRPQIHSYSLLSAFFSFLNCPQVVSNKYMYPTLLYSIHLHIPSYSILSANPLLNFIVCKFPLQSLLSATCFNMCIVSATYKEKRIYLFWPN